MKWMLITWYIAGGYAWNSYEFDSKKTCEAAQRIFALYGEREYNGRSHPSKEFLWLCMKK